MPDLTTYAYIGIVGVSVILFSLFIWKKYRKKRVKKPEREIFPEIVDFTDIEEPVPEKQKPVVIQWKGSKPEQEYEEPEVVEPEEEKEEYACENCPEGRLHKKSDVFECTTCHKVFCSWHLQPHINKRHRSQDYVVSSSENGLASYKRGK